MSELNIYQKMSGITQELKAVAKNLSVGEGRSQYKATGEADILAAVKPLEEKYGIYSYPVARKIVDQDRFFTERTYKGEVTKTLRIFLRLEVTYRFVNADKPEECIDIITFGDGLDTADKAPGKAMTYADKYALMKAYKIISGDDPDQRHSDKAFGDDNFAGEAKETKVAMASPIQVKVIGGYPQATQEWICGKFGVSTFNELTKDQATEIIKTVNAKRKAAVDKAEIVAEAREAFEGENGGLAYDGE